MGQTVFQFRASREAVLSASRYLPAGVGSEFRRGVSPTPLVLTRGDGPFVYDLDRNRLIDYYLGMGPMILGHTPPEVIQAVSRQVGAGILYGGQSELEYEAARILCDIVPCAERVRFGSSGSEAIHAAIRLARAATGRDVTVKFEGHYHGWLDDIFFSVSPSLDAAGPRATPKPVAGSRGQPADASRNVSVLPWNDLPLLERRLRAGDVAAVVMEPAMCNTSAIAPRPGYLEGVRQACDETGTVLIFDEVITGFRLALGGAQQRFKVTPDLAVLGKALASGFPVSAIVGRAAIMDLLDGRSGVVHAGTYNGGAVSMAATIATLKTLCDPSTYAAIETSGTRLMDGLSELFDLHGIGATISGWPAIFHVAFGLSEPSTDYRTATLADRALYVQFTTALLEHGVRALERGAWFISSVHSDQVIDETLQAVDATLGLLQRSSAPPSAI